MEFGEYVRSKGFTAKSLADKAGLNPRTVEAYMYGRFPLKNARAWFIVALADALDTAPKALLQLDD